MFVTTFAPWVALITINITEYSLQIGRNFWIIVGFKFIFLLTHCRYLVESSYYMATSKKLENISITENMQFDPGEI